MDGKFEENIVGARIGAPIIKDKLFFFANFETVERTQPATTWTSTGSPVGGAQVSLPTYAQMQDLSDFMKKTFDYEKIKYNPFYRSYEFQEKKIPNGYDNISGFNKII